MIKIAYFLELSLMKTYFWIVFGLLWSVLVLLQECFVTLFITFLLELRSGFLELSIWNKKAKLENSLSYWLPEESTSVYIRTGSDTCSVYLALHYKLVVHDSSSTAHWFWRFVLLNITSIITITLSTVAGYSPTYDCWPRGGLQDDGPGDSNAFEAFLGLSRAQWKFMFGCFIWL